MTLFQVITGLLILLTMVVRPFLYKPCVKYFPAELSATFTSVWLLVGLGISWPVLGHLLTDNFSDICSSPYILLSIMKGVLLWAMIKFQQVVNKESTSSSVFFGFVAMALGALVNNLFFHEGLKKLQLLSICILGMLGVIFILRGDAERLSLRGKVDFILIIIIGAMFSVFDHLAIPQVGWYPHVFFSSVFMYLVCFVKGISKQDYSKVFCNYTVAIAGIVYTISEFLIIYASINILPVSFVAVFMRMAAPIVMIISAVVYHEQDIKKQLTFGGLALLFVIPLIFG